MSKGIVVDHKESGVRYAISEANFNKDVHRKVRDLKPGETVLGFHPLRRESLGDQDSTAPAPDRADALEVLPGDSRDDPKPAHKAETPAKPAGPDHK